MENDLEKIKDLLSETANIDDVISLFRVFLVFVNELKNAASEDIKEVDSNIESLKQEFIKKIEEAISIAKETQKMEGRPGHTPTDEEIIALIKPLIPEPQIVEKVIEKTTEIIVKEQPIVTQEIREVAIAESAEEILRKIGPQLAAFGVVFRNGLELLETGEKLKISAIEGLEEELKKLKDLVSSSRGRVVVGGTRNVGTSIYEEIPAGSGTSFTLAHVPVAGTVRLYRGGARQQVGIGKDYTISGTNITLAVALVVGEILIADYTF